jgi:hypothetical protein
VPLRKWKEIQEVPRSERLAQIAHDHSCKLRGAFTDYSERESGMRSGPQSTRLREKILISAWAVFLPVNPADAPHAFQSNRIDIAANRPEPIIERYLVIYRVPYRLNGHEREWVATFRHFRLCVVLPFLCSVSLAVVEFIRYFQNTKHGRFVGC